MSVEDEILADQEGIAQVLEMFPQLDLDFIHSTYVLHDFDVVATINHLITPDFEDSAAEDLYSKKKQQRSERKQIVPVNIQYASSSSTYPVEHQQQCLGRERSSYHQIKAGNSESFRESAQQLMRERNEYFNRASQEYKKGKHGKVVAAYYAKRGHELNELAKQENINAAFAQVHASSRYILSFDYITICSEGVLDLHYLRVSEAETVLDHELTKPDNLRRRKLMVITGRGTGKLFSAVEGYLKANGYKYEKCDSYFMVSL